MSIVPYGAWPSPLSPEVASGARVSVSSLLVTGDGSWWWCESRPEEGGRQVVVRRSPDGEVRVVSPPGVSVRTRVHEYGGTAYTVADGELLYVSGDDGALWAVGPGTGEGDTPAALVGRQGAAPRRLNPTPPAGEYHRYAEPQAVPGTEWVVAVRERHHDGTVDDEVVALSRGGGPEGGVAVLHAGRDLYAAPRPSPDGRWLAFVAWDLPAMPWESSELWVAPLATNGGSLVAGGSASAARVAGGPGESVGQPTWAPDGSLVFVSDRFGWWQPFRSVPGAAADPVRVCAEEMEFHAPDWALGQATLAPLPGGRLACRFRRAGRDGIGVVPLAGGPLAEVAQPCVSIAAVRTVDDTAVALIGATATEPAGLHRITLDGTDSVVHRPRPVPLTADWVSRAEPLSFATTGGHEARLLYFGPTAPGLHGPDEPPPLVVVCHGGPTGAAESAFDLGVQLWTTRGIAVALVDYRGSSGYGRAYRDLLRGEWGVADAEDCAAAASMLADRGLAAAGRMVLRGTSAGGFTALRALRQGGPFAAAVVSYAVTDLRALVRETHKFESGYCDGLVGPWPEAADRYDDRSPASHPEEIAGAVLLLQGEDDPVVPPDQARRMAEAMRRQGRRCELVLFPGEGHGFRRAETLAEAARLELSFVASVLGLDLPT